MREVDRAIEAIKNLSHYAAYFIVPRQPNRRRIHGQQVPELLREGRVDAADILHNAQVAQRLDLLNDRYQAESSALRQQLRPIAVAGRGRTPAAPPVPSRPRLRLVGR